MQVLAFGKEETGNALTMEMGSNVLGFQSHSMNSNELSCIPVRPRRQHNIIEHDATLTQWNRNVNNYDHLFCLFCCCNAQQQIFRKGEEGGGRKKWRKKEGKFEDCVPT
jgi:hypothetical protein